jgi:hypothetical protein
MSPIAGVPVIDLREGGPLRRAREGADRAKALRAECVAWLPRVVGVALPLIDTITRRWVRRSASPYVQEIEAIAATLGHPGVWFLNGCYQWGCTSLARDQAGAPWLARTLDWPFPGLGRYLEIARLQGPAGVFENVGWPGYVGALTASAPGRFAAVINQAPLRRRTRHPWLRPLDIALNAMQTWRVRFIPPDHLLRQVFETCQSYSEAKHRLETTPIARPAIYALVGCKPGEGCVIERTEQDHMTRGHDTAAANDWMDPNPRWEARTRADLMFVRTYEEAAASSRSRHEHIAQWSGTLPSEDFDWVTPPILNPYTRVAVEMCPASGVLRAVGYEAIPGAELPRIVASTCQQQQAA